MDTLERISKNLERAAKHEHVSVLDLMPDDFGGMLRGKSYAYWRPPGSPEIVKKRPRLNLASFLSSPEAVGAQRILVPLIPLGGKAEFKYEYGLSEELGVTFEDFMRLVEEGRLVLQLAGPPSEYDADFYKGLFTACKRAGYTPPYSSYRNRYVCAHHQTC
jgi:hypothetical protein